MAKITVCGDAVVVTSSLTVSDIKKLKKYRPEALVLKGGEDGKEPIFAIGVTCGKGRINECGAEFASETNNADGLATITCILVEAEGDLKEFVAEYLGSAILNLNKLEATLPGVLAELDAEKAAVLENITVA